MASTPTLKDKLDFVADGYHKSVFTLQNFVNSMDSALEHRNTENLQGIETWWERVKGTPPPPSVEPSQFEPGTFLRRVYEDSLQMIKRFPGMLYEMAFIYRIALFDAYLSDVLLVLLCSHPEILKSTKTLTHEEVINAPDKVSLIRLMAERELSSVTRDSIKGPRST